MNNLSNFKPVVDALARVARQASISNDNGTSGQAYECHYYDYEDGYDKAKSDLELAMGKAMFSGKTEEVKRILGEIENLPPVRRTLMFKLLTPIRRLQGSKIEKAGDKTYSPVMTNVDIIHIPEDAVNMGILDYEESTDMVEDRRGEATPVIRIKLTACMLDVKEAMTDAKGNITRAARANVTPLSYRSMQVVGAMMSRDVKQARKTSVMEEFGL